MACRGLHLALSVEEMARLRAAKKSKRASLIGDEFEELYCATDRGYETDKAWDALHRCLADGTLTQEGGSFPLNHAILGGEYIPSSEDYFIRAVSPQQCGEVATALAKIDERWLRDRYFKLGTTDYCEPPSEQDFEYTWNNLEGLGPFFRAAAERGHWVIFTVDQ